jgi:ABC-type phosphate/phosphonate transport system substrate-binding protein
MNARIRACSALVIVLGLRGAVSGEEPARGPDRGQDVRIGAVAYSPDVVTVFQGLTRYLNKNGLPCDYVLYSSYDALVTALDRGDVEIAWNTPLAHARYHVKNECRSQTLVMRDVDVDIRSTLVVRAGSDIKTPADLAGKKLVLGSEQAAEATVLPLHFLKKEGVDFGKLDIVSLDAEVDSRGNPCASPLHVLQALRDGRGDAGIITLDLWNRVKDQPSARGSFKQVWVSPPFSHCVFTASAKFDKSLGARFTELMKEMDADDAATKDVLRLEGAKKWLAGSPVGFEALVEALRDK